MVTARIGHAVEEKWQQYFLNATEKVTRLLKNKQTTSFQSRDAVKQQWGGGVSYQGIICAFSGFPEKLDEALSMIYALYFFHGNEEPTEFSKNVLLEWERNYPDNEYIPTILDSFVEGFYKSEVAVKV